MARNSLGTLTLDLVAKIGGFTAPMDQAERQARKSAKGIASAADEASAAWAGLGKIAGGALAGLSVAGLFTRFISETRSAQTEQAQLAAVLASTGNAAGFTQDQLNAMADSLEDIGTTSAGEINKAQTALLAFTGVVGNEFVRAQAAALDMSERTGMSIVAAAETIGRALDVPSKGLTALSRQGFRFTEDQKALVEQLESTGRAAEAQGIILQALEETYGGAAAAARDTFDGALLALQNTISGLLTGEGSLQAAQAAINAVNDALSSPVAAAAIEALSVAAIGLAAVMAGRLAGSAAATAASFALAQREAIRYQLALATMAGVSTRTAVAITAAGVAARGAAAAMALLGGPVGLAVLAASALVYFGTRASETSDEAAGLREEVDYLNASFDGFTRNQAQAALLDIQEQFLDAQLRAIDAGDAVNRYERLLKDLPNDARVQEWNAALIRARGEFDTAGQAVSALTGKIEQLNVIIARSDVSGAAVAVSKTYADMAAKINEQILLHGLETDAARLDARIKAGLVEGLLDGEAEKLLALQRSRDAQLADEAQRNKAQEAAKAAGRAAAEAAKSAAKAAADQAKAIQQSVEALAVQAQQVGWTSDAIKLYELRTKGATEAQLASASASLAAVDAYEKQQKAREDYAALVADLRTEEEQLTATLRAQMAVIDAMGDLDPEERRKQAGRVTEGLFDKSEAPTFSGVDAGPLGELSKLDDAEKGLQKWYDNQLEMLATFRQERSDLNDEWDEREREIKQQHEATLASIERSRWQVGLDSMDSFLTQMQGLRETDSKKGKQAAKAAAIVQATINAYTAATGAYASASAIPVVGWVLGPVAAAAALAAGLANVSAIQGMAHDGIDSVPQTGTWLLEKGERVTTAGTSAKLDSTLSRIQSDMAEQRGGRPAVRGGFTLNQTNNFANPDNRTANQVAAATGRQQRLAAARLGS